MTAYLAQTAPRHDTHLDSPALSAAPSTMLVPCAFPLPGRRPQGPALRKSVLAARPSPTPPTHVYAALYSTLASRWGRQAQDLAAHNELAQIVQKRPRAMMEEEEDGSDEHDISNIDDITSCDGARRMSSSNGGAQPPELCSTPVGAAGDLASLEMRTAHKRRRANPPVPARTTPEGSNTDEAHFGHLLAPQPSRHRRSSSVPIFDTAPSSIHGGVETDSDDRIDFHRGDVPLRMIRSTSAVGSAKFERVEGLLNVVKSFETLLGCRVEMWRNSQARSMSL